MLKEDKKDRLCTYTLDTQCAHHMSGATLGARDSIINTYALLKTICVLQAIFRLFCQ